MNCFGPAWRDSDRPDDRGRAATLATLLGGSGHNGIIAQLMLKPGHIIIERRPGAPYRPVWVRCGGTDPAALSQVQLNKRI
jgi:hypothetical protein